MLTHYQALQCCRPLVGNIAPCCPCCYASSCRIDPGLAAHHTHTSLLLSAAPPLPTCMQTAAVTSFVRQHQVLRTDTLQMLAVRHGVTVPCLKRVNNLMTDHALHSRTHLFIPGGARPADHTACGYISCITSSALCHHQLECIDRSAMYIGMYALRACKQVCKCVLGGGAPSIQGHHTGCYWSHRHD